MKRFLSIDIEASGPIPEEYYMCSLGCCPVEQATVKDKWMVNRGNTFYVEFSPHGNANRECTRIHGLTHDYLTLKGYDPKTAMELFERYWKVDLQGNTTCAAMPASFDFMFLRYYVNKYCRKDFAGFYCLDIGSLSKGFYHSPTSSRTTMKRMKKDGFVAWKNDNPHNALTDAIEQAYVLEYLLNRMSEVDNAVPKV